MTEIKKLRIKNVLGVELLELDGVGKLVKIHGKNGSGKSSILKALALAFGGKKQDPELLRSGAEEGEVYVVLDDGTEIRRKITEKGAGPAKVKEPKFGASMRGAESYLKGLLGAGWSPIAFLSKKGRERVASLLEAMPIVVEPERVNEATATVELDVGMLPLDLDGLDRVIAKVYETRRNCNVMFTEARHASQSLADTLEGAPESEEEATKELAGAREELDFANVQWNEGKKAAREKYHGGQKETEKAFTERKALLEDVAREEIEAIKKRLAEEVEKITAERDKVLKGVEKKYENATAALEEEWGPVAEDLKARVAKLEESTKGASRAAGQREVLEDLEKKRDVLKSKHEALDGAHDRLLELKRRLLEELPIDGIEIKDGELWVKDASGELRHFDKLNTAEQIKFAVRLGTLQLGELRALVVDNLEALDPEHRKVFLAEAAKSGVQHFLAFADEGELTVEG